MERFHPVCALQLGLLYILILFEECYCATWQLCQECALLHVTYEGTIGVVLSLHQRELSCSIFAYVLAP